MIVYDNRKKYIREHRHRARLSTFHGIDERAIDHTLPVKYVSDMVGMETDKGMIHSTIGVSPIRAKDGSDYRDMQFTVDNIYPFYLGGKRVIILSAGGRGYMLDEDKKLWAILPSIYFSGQNAALFTIGEEPSIIIPRAEGGLVSYNGTAFKEIDLPYKPVLMATHMNRLYMVDEGDEYRLRFSGIDDPFNFNISLNMGGEIYLDVEDGKIVNLISHGGNLYIFREYGIYRLTAYADQREFRVKKIATTTTKIDGASVVLAGGRMLMRTENGIYAFDGYNMTRVLESIESRVESMTASTGIYYKDRYYLSYALKGESELTHLLVWDMNTNGVSILDDVHITRFAIIRSNVDDECLAVAIAGAKQLGILDDGYTIMDTEIDRHWTSDEIDFGEPDTEKELVRVVACVADRYALTIEVDDRYRYRYEVDGRARSYHLGLRGYRFRFTIEPTTIGDIRTPLIEYKV